MMFPQGQMREEPVGLGKKGQEDGQYDERYVLEPGQWLGDADFTCFHLVHHILHPAERAEPSAHGAAHGQTDDAEISHQKEWDLADGLSAEFLFFMQDEVANDVIQALFGPESDQSLYLIDGGYAPHDVFEAFFIGLIVRNVCQL